MYVCSSCNNCIYNGPVYECPKQHPYCENCYGSLKLGFRGSFKSGSVCNVPGIFEKTKDKELEFIESLQYHTNRNFRRRSTVEASIQDNIELRNLPTHKLNQFKNSQQGCQIQPFCCPDDDCGKWITPSLFVTHFNLEHYKRPKYSLERNEELKITCDMNQLEYNKSRCIGLLTVYEFNKIDLIKSKSSQNVINTCNKFSRKVPINIFYLMETGIGTTNDAYIVYWLFNSTEESYPCTIELSSQFDLKSVACFFHIKPIRHCHDYVKYICEELNGLFLCKQSVKGLLVEGTNLNLRIIVH